MELSLYLEKLINIFNLKHWEINLVLIDKLKNENVGETYFIDNDYSATITIKEENFNNMLETLIHEIIHIVKRNSQLIAIEHIDNKDIYNIWFREMEKEQQVLAKGIKTLLLLSYDD